MAYPQAPIQLRSIDPYDKTRSSREQNLKSRMLTFGRSSILYESSSFIPTYTGTSVATPDGNMFYKIRISSGLCVIDDVMIHIRSNWIIDITDGGLSEGQDPSEATTYHMIDHNNGYTEDDFIGDSSGTKYIYVHYNYFLSQPAPTARIFVTKNPEYLVHNGKYLYIGKFETYATSYNGVYYITPDSLTTASYNHTISQNTYTIKRESLRYTQLT